MKSAIRVFPGSGEYFPEIVVKRWLDAFGLERFETRVKFLCAPIIVGLFVNIPAFYKIDNRMITFSGVGTTAWTTTHPEREKGAMAVNENHILLDAFAQILLFARSPFVIKR